MDIGAQLALASYQREGGGTEIITDLVEEITGRPDNADLRAYMRTQLGTRHRIEEAAGFNDVSYFTRLFSQTFGVTPSEFPSLED